MKECIDCKIRAEGCDGIFDISCKYCRTAIALSEKCKVTRKQLVERMMKRWGETEGWEAEPNCGCTKHCEQNQRIKKDVQE